MKAGTFLFLLPISITLLQTQGQAVADDPPVAADDKCIEMTDEKTAELNDMVHEITDFLNALADRYEYFALKYIKLDIEKPSEDETEDQNTLLEVLINNCGTELNDVSEDFIEKNTNSVIESIIETLNENSDNNDTVKRTKDEKETFFEYLSELENTYSNVTNSENKTNKKFIHKVTPKITRKKKFVIDDSTTSDQSIITKNSDRIDKSTKKTENDCDENIKIEDKNDTSLSVSNAADINHSTSHVEDIAYKTDSNYQSTSNNAEVVDNNYQTTSEDESISNNENNYQSKSEKQNITTNKNVQMNNLYEEDTQTTVNNINKINKILRIINQTNENISEDDIFIQNSKTSLNNVNIKNQMRENHEYLSKNNESTYSTDTYEKNNSQNSVNKNRKSVNERHSIKNIDYDNEFSTDDSNVENIKNNRQDNSDNENDSSHTKNGVSLSNKKRSDNSGPGNNRHNYFNKHKTTNENNLIQRIINFDESILLQSLKHIIKTEVENNMKSINNMRPDAIDSDTSKDYDKYSSDNANHGEPQVNNEYATNSKPQVVWMDLGDIDKLDEISRKKYKNKPWLVYLQDRGAQQRQITFL